MDPDSVGLGDWGRPSGYLERQLNRWRKQWEASVTTPRPEVEELLRRLSVTLPDNSFLGIVHGDFKVDNMMVSRDDPTRIIGVLDWEMSTLGDTLTDLGILCSFWLRARTAGLSVGSSTTLAVDRSGPAIVVARLDRPERLNAITFEMVDEFVRLQREVESAAAAGAGMALALAADIWFAATTARCNAAFVQIGLSGGDVGTSWALPRLVVRAGPTRSS